jgi:hypothetical protein
MSPLHDRSQLQRRKTALYEMFMGGTPNGLLAYVDKRRDAVVASNLPPKEKNAVLTAIDMTYAPILWDLEDFGGSVFDDEGSEEEMEGATVVGVPA